jgi:hypothetical protein
MTSDDGGLHRPEAVEGCGAASMIPCGNAGIADSRKPSATESCTTIRAGERIGRKLSTSSARAEFAPMAARCRWLPHRCFRDWGRLAFALERSGFRVVSEGGWLMEWPKCQKCNNGSLIPLSDYGQEGASVLFKAWVCTNPDCGFSLRVDKGEVTYGRRIETKH